MSSVTSLLDELRGREIQLWTDGEQICYRSPAGALTPELSVQLKTRKADLIHYLASGNAIARIPDQPHYEISHAQRRMWILSQLDSAAVAYCVPLRFALEGSLDRAALGKALAQLVARHETLRTTFISLAGEPRQIVHPSNPPEVRELEVDAESAAEDQVLAFAEAEASLPFDLERGPLFRVALVKVSAQRHVLLLALHHIVCDGWSVRVMVKDLADFYSAALSGGTPHLSVLKIQYRDFAAWQNLAVRSGEMQPQAEYWLGKLKGSSPSLDLPLDTVRPPFQTFRGGELTLRLEADVAGELRAYSRSRHSTVFTAVIALIKILLFRYSGQNDIVVGTPVAGRRRVELDEQVGCYLNTLALRDRLEGGDSFDTVFRQVRQTLLEALDHQDYPFDDLIEALSLPRDLSRSPLFDVMIIRQSAAGLETTMGGLLLSRLPMAAQTSQFDLTFHYVEGEDFVEIGIEYNADLFAAKRIEAMAAHLRELTVAALADPGRRISQLNLLPPAERTRLVVDFNPAPTQPFARGTFIEMFEAQVVRTSDAVAVTFEDASLTYRELNQRANQLARHVRRLGVRREVLAGICVERSLDLIVGLLGILKAGGAYVPLDPSYPAERLRFSVDDSGISVLLTQSKLGAIVAAPHVRQVFLDVGWEAISREPVENLESSVEAENLAYVLYTSGSTGQPKAVGVRHASVANFLNSMRIEPGFGDRDALLAVTTICFDIAGLELFLPLVTGGRVVIASRETASDGALLLGLVQSSGATAMQATPATWRMLLAAGWRGSSGLKILCGGEALPRELANKLLERSGSVWNLYGPTETTIWSALSRVETGAKVAAVEPIGRPIANTVLYILDQWLQPVPQGVNGDLYIGGEGIARGYLSRPALTAERFLPSPFGSGSSRIYQTGDIARYLPDGTIEFLGRRDDQVKIRGYRIELGEIEAALATHSALREVAVIARAEESGAKHLVAYVVPREGASFSALEMRSHLAKTMPEYMVPSICVLLERVPLTPNGKIDRLALSLSGGAVPTPLASAHVAPRDAVEQAFATLWQEVLNVETLGVYDDFFALGGHSLRAAKVIALVKRDFGVSLTLREFFASPTIAQLAALARSKQSKDPVLKRACRIGKAKPLVVGHDGLTQPEWMQLQ